MNDTNQDLSLGEAAVRFLASLGPEERAAIQPEVHKFARWFGAGRPLSGLTAAEVDNYVERLSLSDADYTKRLEMIRAFLLHARKEGWSKTNLAVHLKPRKGKAKTQPAPKRNTPETVYLTRQGHAELQVELAELKNQRFHLIEEIRKAAADKDFRENAPLHAAREQRSHIEGRILDIEATLKCAAIIDDKPDNSLKLGIGHSVVLCDLNSGEEMRYTLVSPREVDLAKGKISNASPIGRAVTGKSLGEIVEVAAPVGRLRYQVKQIE
jgi:transcription elongation factor GreA